MSAEAAIDPGEGTTAKELLKQADAALYRAKWTGPNQITLADSLAS